MSHELVRKLTAGLTSRDRSRIATSVLRDEAADKFATELARLRAMLVDLDAADVVIAIAAKSAKHELDVGRAPTAEAVLGTLLDAPAHHVVEILAALAQSKQV